MRSRVFNERRRKGEPLLLLFNDNCYYISGYLFIMFFFLFFSQNPVCWGRPSLTAQEAVNLSSRVKCAETKLPATTTELRRAKAVK